jgi:hypothetical protein
VLGVSANALGDSGLSEWSAPLERSSLFALGQGDRVMDAGVMVVQGGSSPRSEFFEVVRQSDGGRQLTSLIEAADGSYRVEGRWRWSADGAALSARGIGDYQGKPVEIEIRTKGGSARIAARIDGEPAEATAPCDPCLIDMAPSTLPMFSMTRLYDDTQGGVQRFHWIGRSLVRDEVLTDGAVDLWRVRRGEFVDADGHSIQLSQYAFTETLTDSATGRELQLDFNLYVDREHRPLGFAMRRATGFRRGFEALAEQMPPIFERPSAADSAQAEAQAG